MGNVEDCEKSDRIVAFLRDKNKFAAVVAAVNRMLRRNQDGTRSSYGLYERAVTAQDIVADLVQSALVGGPRRWNEEEMPSLEGWIITQAKSVKSNLVRKQLRPIKRKHNSKSDAGEPGPRTDTMREIVSLEGKLAEGEFDLLDETDCIRDFEDAEFIGVLKKELRLHDRKLECLVLEQVLEQRKNEEIAFALKIAVSEVVNAKKRIYRVVDRLLRGAERLN